MGYVETLDDLKGVTKQERRINAQSGVKNLTRDYAIAQNRIEAQDGLKTWFAEYRKAGGKAKNPVSVKHTAGDPCAAFQNLPDAPVMIPRDADQK